MAVDRTAELGNFSIEEDGKSSEIDLSLLYSFVRETNAINKVLEWIKTEVPDASRSITKANGDESKLKSIEKRLEEVNKRILAIRARLDRMNTENKEFVKEHHATSPSTVKLRLVQYRNMGQNYLKQLNQFADIVTQLRDARRHILIEEIRQMDPNASISDIISGPIVVQQIQQGGPEEQRKLKQLEIIRETNKDLEKVTSEIEQLHLLFRDMTVVLNSQGELINEIEATIQKQHKSHAQVVEELGIAHDYRERGRKKKRAMFGIIMMQAFAVVAAAANFVINFTNRRQF